MVLSQLLPPLLLNDPTFKKWKPHLEDGYRQLLDNPGYNVSSNFSGIKYEAEIYYDDEFLSTIGSKIGAEHEEAYRRACARAEAYVSAVKDLATRLRLGESYGPPLIHGLIHWAVTSPGHYRPPATLSKPVRLSLEIEVSPMAQYYPDDIPELPNPVASYYPKDEPLPDVSWAPQGTNGTHFQATITVRDLVDLRKALDALVGLLGRDGGLRLQKPRGGAYQHLGRNTKWFYLNRCKKKSPNAICEGLVGQGDSNPPDVSTIQKGIDQVRQLLSSIRAS